MDDGHAVAENYSTLEAVEQNVWAHAPELDSTTTAPQVAVKGFWYRRLRIAYA